MVDQWFHWDVWGTTYMNGGTYTISNDTSNHVRSWDYYQSNYSSKGLHYKRTGSGGTIHGEVVQEL